MLDLSHIYEGTVNQVIQKKTKTPLSIRNSNRTFQPMSQLRNPTPQSFMGIKKRIALQKGRFSPELKKKKKKRKKTNMLAEDYSPPSLIYEKTEEIANSLCLLTKKVEKDRRKEIFNNLKTYAQKCKSEQILSNSFSSTTLNKLEKNHTDIGKQKLGIKNKVAREVTNSHIRKCNKEQEISRIKSSLEPIRASIAENMTDMLSVSNRKPLHSEMSSRKLKKMQDRLERVRDFLKSINAMETRTATCSDGINHKDIPQKNSSSDPSEGTDRKGNDHYRNIQHIGKSRRIINRNRVFASRPPLLETVIEEPEKEEEEAKFYEML